MIRPRQFQLRGSVEAVAFLVDERLGGRARVLSLWQPGTSVHRVEDGYLLRLQKARRVFVDRAGAIPFVEQHGVIASAPLAADEVEPFAKGAFVHLRGGEVNVLAIGASIDPAVWIDVDEWSIRELEPLGDPPAAAILAVPPPPASEAVFGRIVGPPPAQRAAVIAALRTPEPIMAGQFAAFATRVLTALSMALKTKPGLVARAGPRRGPSTLDWIKARMQDLLTRLLVATRLAQLVGRRQAAYVEELFDLFEKGDLDEALRRAIPLDGESAGNAAPALGVPGRRNELAIRLERQNAGSNLGFGENLFMALRRTYRAALEKLEREGRIDEAAFVLAELLKADEEAVAFLERHGRYRLAADIADARNLAPELRVRQRFLAGDREHAIALARAHGAFSGAIARLERTNLVDAASALRLEWANLLARGGDYTAAVDAIWPLLAARHVALRWIELGVELGGVAGARMLARKVALDGSEDLLDRVQAVLHSPDGARVRHAFARELLQQETTPIVRLCARAAARAIYADAGVEDDGTLQPLVRDLVHRADDAALRADRPTWPPAATNASTRRVHARFDAGTIPISDAALLPDGRTVVALGEAGVRILSRAGRVVTQFDQPADHLVISDRGDRAIAVARRGDASRLARIDLVDRRSEPWCEAHLGVFAQDFDGTTWIAGEGDRSLLIDVLSPGFTALSALGAGEPIAIARTSRGMIAILAVNAAGEVEGSTYDLPSHQLRTRAAMRPLDRDHCAIATDTTWAALLPSQDHVALHTRSSPEEGVPIGEPGDRPGMVAIDGTIVAAVLVATTGARVLVFGHATKAVLHDLFFEGSTRAGLRLQDGNLIAWDDRGRVIALNPARGKSLRDLRI